MTWFLNLRQYGTGGGVADQVTVMDDSGKRYPGVPAEFLNDIRGRDVLLATHGFAVSQKAGLQELTDWEGVLDLGPNGAFVGVLWPGDSCWLPFLHYPEEYNEADASGDLLAPFLEANFTSAVSISFSSHSLGARMVLQAVSGLQAIHPRRVMLMAGAIDADCLTTEYAKAAQAIGDISVLASREDWVLEFSFPVGNPVATLITPGHPYYKSALGREGPAPTTPAQVTSPWQLPDSWNYGHLDYLGADGPAYRKPVDVPPPEPPPADPIPCKKPNWSAAYVSTRFR